MKHWQYIVYILLCTSSVTSCQTDENEWTFPTSELEMSVAASIGASPSIQGRYTVESPNNAYFAEKDSIGIFINGDSIIRWNYENSSWKATQKVYWPDKESKHEFKAFYPYAKAESANHIPMPNLHQQDGTLSKIPQYDFLVATTSQSYNDNKTVIFQGDHSFQHVSSLIHLHFAPEEDLTNATLDTISINAKDIVTSSYYSFTNGVKLSDSSSDNLKIVPNYSMAQGERSYYLIVNAKNDSTSVVTFRLDFTVGNQKYTAQKVGFANNLFPKGMLQNYKITVRNRSLYIEGGGIAPWSGSEDLKDIIIDIE